MMMGGRRCGKTSVLAAMQQSFEERLNNTSLVMGPADFEMLEILEKKQQEMLDYFLKRGDKTEFSPNNISTSGIMNYSFYIGLKSKKSRIRLDFVDYPGEYLTLKEEYEQLKDPLKKSRILLIAIDTPHLMERKGLYNDPKNRCRRVTEIIKESGFADADRGPGMVLLVPLKCERYYNHGRMNNVAAEVQKAYGPLLQYLQQPDVEGQSSRITIAITPILTIGGAEFSCFQYTPSGNIEVDVTGVPKYAFYRFSDMKKDAPEPLYCEQPLLYVLSYLFCQAERLKSANKARFFGIPLLVVDIIQNWFEGSVLKWPSAEDYLTQASAVAKAMKCTGDGYRILSKGILKL